MTQPEDVLALLGRSGDAGALAIATAALPVVREQIRAYTRGNGFSGDQPAPDIDSVVLTSATRWVANPESLRAEKVGPFEQQRQIVEGWTLSELAILNRHRRKAAG